MGEDDQRIRTGAERMGVTPEGSAHLRLGTIAETMPTLESAP